MRTNTYRRPRPASALGMRRWQRVSLLGFGVLIGLFVVANVGMAWLYRQKVLPNYSVAAVPVGGIRFEELDQRVDAAKLLPAELKLSKDDKVQRLKSKDIGVAVDWPATRQHLEAVRLWLPLLSLVTKHEVPAELKLDGQRFDAKAKELEPQFAKTALPERIVLTGENFAIAPPEAGYRLDLTNLKRQVAQAAEEGKTALEVPVTPTAATEPTGQLGGELELLQKRLAAKITFISAGKTKQLSRGQIGRFYEPAGQTMQLSNTKAGEVVGEVASGFGITAVNQNDAVNASLYALIKSQPVTFQLATQSTKVYHYCTAVKGGVNSSVLPEFRQKLAAVYGDPHGWNQGGVTLVYAESGCDYTAWLSAASAMTSFGGVCDNYYSCRSGPNVVINYDRWMGATDPWNAAHGSLEDYRVMVINHETGHWLGFAHHHCTAPGQLAPVMQQQSIDLEGCTFNPWPTAAEIAVLR